METLYQSEDASRIVLLTRPAEVDVFVAALERIAAELSWQPGEQVRACAAHAMHMAVLIGDELAGGMQVVAEGRNSILPCRRVWPEVETADATVHVTIMALEKAYRGPGLFWPLCVELWRWCDAKGIGTILMEATPTTLRVYRRMGWPLEIVGDLRAHWGEECYLCRTGVRQMEEAIVARARRSGAYRAFVEQGHRDRA